MAGERKAAAASKQATQVRAWLDDPGAPDAPNTPVEHPVPNLAAKPFPSAITGRAPAPGDYAPGTTKFRYWAAADALRRVGDQWGHVLGNNVNWHATVGARLKVILDAGEDLNAYYDRKALNFFQASRLRQGLLFGRESRRRLSRVRPRDPRRAPAAALGRHERRAPGIPRGLRRYELDAHRAAGARPLRTGDHVDVRQLDRSSRLSRLAEQLGWAIRQGHPDAVDRDCLRNAANSFFYQDPVNLPPRAPASQLSSEPHSFSRVFSGAFLNVLAGMFALQPKRDVDALMQVGQEVAQLLTDAIQEGTGRRRLLQPGRGPHARRRAEAVRRALSGCAAIGLRGPWRTRALARGHRATRRRGDRRDGARGHRRRPPARRHLRESVRVR